MPILLISILIGCFMSININVTYHILTSLLIIVILMLFNKKVIKAFIFYSIVCAIFLIFTSYKINSYDFKYKDKESIKGEFVIVSVEEKSEYYNKYICKNKSNNKFILKVKTTDNIKLKEINKIYLEGTFILPELNRNEGAFNYRRYLNSKNIYGTIIAKSDSVILIENAKISFIANIKNIIEETLNKLLPVNYAGIINGMLNGNTKNISKSILNSFKESGITHLLAVSGSNIAFLIMFVSFCFKKIIGKYLSYYAIIISIITFIFVSGSSASVLRAGIMAILNILAILFSRKSNTLNNISFSAIIILAINPLIVYDVGFILSFAGTIGIVLLSKKITAKIEKIIKLKFIAETLGVTLAAQITLLPIMAYYFNKISLISIIPNLLIVPISGILTILGFITVIITNFNIYLGQVIAYVMYSLVFFMINISDFFAKIPWGNTVVSTPRIWMIVLYYMIICLVASGKSRKLIKNVLDHKKMRILKKLLLVIIGILIATNILPRNHVKLNMIDVGQGDSFYIETQNGRTILIDGGGSESSDYDIGENVVVPYILDRGKKVIDLAIISHPHEDHIEGVYTVIEKLKVRKVLISKNVDNNDLIKKFKEICDKRNTEIIEISSNTNFEIDNVYFDVIYPNGKTKDKNINNMSLVIKMKFGEITTLFTGDLEESAEKMIKENIDVDILKVGHHGSKTSTSEDFLRKVSPQVALISVGIDNSYGHPSKEIIKRLEDNNVKIYRTDENGEVKIKISKDRIKIRSHF